MKKMKRKSIYDLSSLFSLTIIVSVSGVLVGCGKNDGNQDMVEPIKVKELIVGDSGLQGEVPVSGGARYSGTIEEENGVSLSFPMGGTVSQLSVKVGDYVRRGQLIGSVEQASVKNAYDIARSTRAQMQDAYDRMRQLHDKGSLAEIKWVEAQSQLQQAVSAENIAKKNLDDCNLYAPADGVISEKLAEVGQNMAPGMPVAKLVTTKVLNAKINVPEGEVSGIKARQRAKIQVQALNGRWIDGYVIEKGVIADPVTRSYGVKIRVEGHDRGLLPGMVANVVLDGVSAAEKSDKGASKIIIPAMLVQLGDDNSNFVWVDENGKAARRVIVCGEYQSDGVVVESGLKKGERLIVEGQQKVCSGTALKAE